MEISSELLKDLYGILSDKPPVKGELRFEQAGAGLMFKILNEKDIHLSGVVGGTVIVDFDVKGIIQRSTDIGLYSENGSAIWLNECNQLQSGPINHISDRECELLKAVIDNQREDSFIVVKDSVRQLKCPYKSTNGGWVLMYENGQRAIIFGKGIAFIFDAVDVVKKYVRLYDSKNEENRLYLSRSKVSPF